MHYHASILGATQVAAGDTKASTGADRHIDMDKMGPAKYWPNYEGCFHPGVLGFGARLRVRTVSAYPYYT